MMTRPSTHTGTAKVQRGVGVTIKYLQYWSDAFKLPGVAEGRQAARFPCATNLPIWEWPGPM
jgi:hypothetical protein